MFCVKFDDQPSLLRTELTAIAVDIDLCPENATVKLNTNSQQAIKNQSNVKGFQQYSIEYSPANNHFRVDKIEKFIANIK